MVESARLYWSIELKSPKMPSMDGIVDRDLVYPQARILEKIRWYRIFLSSSSSSLSYTFNEIAVYEASATF